MTRTFTKLHHETTNTAEKRVVMRLLKRSYVRVAAVASSVSVVSLAFLPKTLLQSSILRLIKVQRLSRVCLVLFGALTSRILSALTFTEK